MAFRHQYAHRFQHPQRPPHRPFRTPRPRHQRRDRRPRPPGAVHVWHQRGRHRTRRYRHVGPTNRDH